MVDFSKTEKQIEYFLTPRGKKPGHSYNQSKQPQNLTVQKAQRLLSGIHPLPLDSTGSRAALALPAALLKACLLSSADSPP